MPRIFQQFGSGYSDVGTPVNIEVQIDGNTVFSGAVPTVNAPVPGYQPDTRLGQLCFEWTEPVANFVGTKSLSISVSGGGEFQLNDTLAQGNVADPDEYGEIYETTIGNVWYGDPLSEVSIGGEAQMRPLNPAGQWGWNIMSGEILTATLNINLLEQPLPPELPPE